MRNKARLLLISILVIVIAPTILAQEMTETPEATDAPTSVPAEATLEPGDVRLEGEATETVTGDIPIEVARHDEDWPLSNGNYSNTRAVFNSNINSATVDQLEVAWAFPIPGRAAYGAAASAPVIASGIVYFQDLESNVFAIDLRTGEVVWQKLYNSPVIGPNGPGIGYGKVFVNSGVATFAALDIETGEEVWSRPSDGPTGAFQPYAYGGYAFFTVQAGASGEGAEGFKSYFGGTSGHILALNPDTGETVWDFQTVEEGFWGNPEVNSGGGVWYPPAIDTNTGLTYWGTGNPAPFAGTFEFPNASSREEPNLYTNSMVALDYDSGELVWFNYVNPNDLFDLDFQMSPILATVQFEGEQREIVIGAGKLGRIIAFDRHTGDIIWDTPVGIHQNDDLTEIPPGETITVYPGILGGVETPMAYANNVVYAPVLNLPTEHTATGFDAANGTEAVANANQHTPAGQGTSEVVALDASTGQVLWSHEFGVDMYGGVTIVNDLLFAATFDGMIYALDRASGQIVWSYQAPAGINAWPAVADDTIIWPAGFGNTPSLVALRLPVDAGVTEPEATDSADAPAETTETAEATAAPEATAEATDGAAPEATAAATEAAGDSGAQEGEFITVDAENQTVTLKVVAAYDQSNGGLNFNGYSNGEATYVVPEGWTVQVEFSNQAAMPHSVMVVPQDAVSQQEMPAPVFEGAATADPTAGMTGSSTFSFTAGAPGTYAFACGVPGHAASGQWLVFEVGASDAEPAFQTGG